MVGIEKKLVFCTLTDNRKHGADKSLHDKLQEFLNKNMYHESQYSNDFLKINC